MPKNLTPAMRAHLDAGTTKLAAIWRITRKDGQQFFFTDHDRDIVFGGDKGWTQVTRTLELWEPAKRAIQAGDQFRLYAGCSKARARGLPRQVPDPRQSPARPGQRQEFSGRALLPGGALVAQAR